ncbi:hypothetical protein EDD17DRAFT_1532080 [Pisolithus thermaeus]|nr:hypothetical protein EDD17DRAFT_1532080 [Pisolithus thermaeus]
MATAKLPVRVLCPYTLSFVIAVGCTTWHVIKLSPRVSSDEARRRIGIASTLGSLAFVLRSWPCHRRAKSVIVNAIHVHRLRHGP